MNKSVKVPAEALGWSLAPGREGLSGLLTDKKQPQVGLQRAGRFIHHILWEHHPRTVDRRRAASGAKTDTIDAYLLAKTGRADLADLHRLRPDSEKIAELKLLTRDQDALIQRQTRLVNQLTACLKAYDPVALELFAKLHQKSTLLFLRTYPTPQAAMAASVEQIKEVLKQAKHSNPTVVAAEIFQRLHQPHLQADSLTTRTKARLMLALVSQLLPLLEQIAQYDKESLSRRTFNEMADYREEILHAHCVPWRFFATQPLKITRGRTR